MAQRTGGHLTHEPRGPAAVNHGDPPVCELFSQFTGDILVERAGARRGPTVHGERRKRRAEVLDHRAAVDRLEALAGKRATGRVILVHLHRDRGPAHLLAVFHQLVEDLQANAVAAELGHHRVPHHRRRPARERCPRHGGHLPVHLGHHSVITTSGDKAHKIAGDGLVLIQLSNLLSQRRIGRRHLAEINMHSY